MSLELETNPYFRRASLPEQSQENLSPPPQPLRQGRRARQVPRQRRDEQVQPLRPRVEDPLSEPPVRRQPQGRRPQPSGEGVPPLQQHPHPADVWVPHLHREGQHTQPHGPQGPLAEHSHLNGQPLRPPKQKPKPEGPVQPSSQRPQDPHPHRQQRQPYAGQMHGAQATKAFTWIGAVFCVIFWLVIIIGGVIVLIVYLVYRPRSPQFEVSTATLNAAYLDMGYLLNADVTLLTNFTNPSRKVRVDFTYMYVDLYYGSTLIASQYVEPFSAARAESKFKDIHLVTSQVPLPVGETRRLQKQMESNAIFLEVRGHFKARANFGSLLRYTYLLHGQCNILMAAPPSGIMIKAKCKTKR